MARHRNRPFTRLHERTAMAASKIGQFSDPTLLYFDALFFMTPLFTITGVAKPQSFSPRRQS
jgi:hypothetical protein